MKIIALIPARGGSKGLPGKNIYPLAGRPLIAYSIDAGKGARLVDEVWVSTDDDAIKERALKEGAKILLRPVEIAGDFSTSAEVVEHFIEKNKLAGGDIIIFLQPTSPLRNAEDVDKALSVFMKCDANMLLSVVEPEHTPLKAFIENEEGYLEGAFSPQAPFMPRQKLPKAYMPNGAIYIFRVDEFLQHKCFPQNKIFPWVMSSEKSIDVDTIADIKNIEKLMESKK